MLDEEPLSGSTVYHVIDYSLRRAKLVVARENQTPAVAFGRGLPQRVVTQDSQEQFRLKNLLPQVCCVRSVLVTWVTSVVAVALVERQECRVRTCENRSHVHLLVGHREVHRRPG